MFTRNLWEVNTSEILKMFVQGEFFEIKPQKVWDICLLNYISKSPLTKFVGTKNWQTQIKETFLHKFFWVTLWGWHIYVPMFYLKYFMHLQKSFLELPQPLRTTLLYPYETTAVPAKRIINQENKITYIECTLTRVFRQYCAKYRL